MIGKGSVIAYPMEKALEKHGGGLDRIQFQQLGSADVLTALQNGGVDSAWLLDPVWRKVDGDARYAFLGGQPLGEPLGGLLYGRGSAARRRGCGSGAAEGVHPHREHVLRGRLQERPGVRRPSWRSS